MTKINLLKTREQSLTLIVRCRIGNGTCASCKEETAIYHSPLLRGCCKKCCADRSYKFELLKIVGFGLCKECQKLSDLYYCVNEGWCRDCWREKFLHIVNFAKIHNICIGCGSPTYIHDDDEDPSLHNAVRLLEDGK